MCKTEVYVFREKCVDNLVHQDDLAKIVLGNASVTMAAVVCHPLGNVSVALDTREKGKKNHTKYETLSTQQFFYETV